jgi:cysteine desulfurase
MGIKIWGIFQKRHAPKRVHLDYASTTPVATEVFKAMRPYFSEVWANPSAIYKEGVCARKVVEDARTELARTLKIRPLDVTFTSGGTEANNLALIGVMEALHNEGKKYEDMEIVSTKIEHPSILETLKYLEKRGVSIVYVPIEEDGQININTFESLLNTKTVLVTFAYVNSEIGVVQDIKKITRIVRAWNESQKVHVYVHTDASQAPLWLSCELDRLGVDLMTLDAGKCYGPKGIGVLAHRHWVKLMPSMHGGGQEQGLRSGTENTALIVGCVKAIVRAQKNYEARSIATIRLREKLFALMEKEIPNAIVNGSREARVANNVNISLPGFDTEYAVIWLDSKGIATSTKSACGAKESTGSNVVREMTKDTERALSTLRFTLGEETNEADLIQTIKILKEHLALMKQQKT